MLPPVQVSELAPRFRIRRKKSHQKSGGDVNFSILLCRNKMEHQLFGKRDTEAEDIIAVIDR